MGLTLSYRPWANRNNHNSYSCQYLVGLEAGFFIRFTNVSCYVDTWWILTLLKPSDRIRISLPLGITCLRGVFYLSLMFEQWLTSVQDHIRFTVYWVMDIQNEFGYLSDWSVHCRQCNAGKSEGILDSSPFTFSEQAALGLKLCPDLVWANFTCLSLVPEREEKGSS